MAATPSSKGGSSPPKPWERAAAQSGAAPFEPSSAGSTSDVVEASGNAKAGEIVPVDNSRPANRNSAGGLSPRPWERNIGNNLGVYNSGSNYSTTFGSGPYGSALGYGGTYGGSLYANSSYGGYSGSYGGYGSYGGPYGGSLGGPVGNYGMGVGAPYSNLGPNGPFGQLASPPGFWMSFLNTMGTLVQTFSRIAMIVNENTHALHILVTALLQVSGHSGRLYGELAPFVLRILGFKSTAKRVLPQERAALPGAPVGGKFVEGPKAASAGWDTYWGN